MNPFWTSSIPIWVSRKNAQGMISQFAVTGWIFMLIGFLVLLNTLAWGFIGLYEAVRVVVL
jgi:hypothetical protein